MQPARSADAETQNERDGDVLEDMRCVDATCVRSRKPACGVSFIRRAVFDFMPARLVDGAVN